MTGKKSKRVRFESWKYPQRADEARGLIQLMQEAGCPLVNRGGVMSWLKYDQRGIRAEPISKDNLLAEINCTIDYKVQKWEKAKDGNGNLVADSYGNPVRRLGEAYGDVSQRTINTAYGMRHNGLWDLRGTLTHPIINTNGQYVIRNGLYWHDEVVNGVMMRAADIHLADGYDPVSQYFFAIPQSVIVALADIPDQKPATGDVIQALDCIDSFLCDFDFATASAKASAIAFMLTMVCREIIGGASVPMLEVRAPASQSGKSLLVKMMINAVTGEPPAPFNPNFRDVSEFEKELLSELLRGRNYIFLDNVYGKVQSSFLDMALTTGIVEKRLLGSNTVASVYSGMPFVMTANNPTLSEDMKNRIYLLDINKPSSDKQFFHQEPEEEALKMQPQILGALFTLYNHWDKNENRAPFTDRRIDGFIRWSRIIGGILQAAGIRDFLVDTIKQIREVDTVLEQAADMARSWYTKCGSVWLFVKDTVEFALEAGYVKDNDSTAQKIGIIAGKLNKLRKTPLPGGFYFERNSDESRGSQWRVVKNGS